MKKTLTTAAIIMALSSPAHSQIDINQDVNDYAKPLSGEISLLPKWQSVIDRQTIVSGTGEDTFEKLQAIFDTPHEYVTDSRNYAPFYESPSVSFDYWATPDEFKAKGGDCEDFAIYWYYEARAQGFKPEQLNIWVGYLPKQGNLQHAVLAVEIGNQEYVLDNYSGTIHKAENYMHEHFKLMFRFNENGWSVK